MYRVKIYIHLKHCLSQLGSNFHANHCCHVKNPDCFDSSDFRVLFAYTIIQLLASTVKPHKCTVVFFLSAPEKLTFVRCKSDESPFIIFYHSGNFFTRCVVLTCFFCALTGEQWRFFLCIHSIFTPFVQCHEDTTCVFMCAVSAWVCVSECVCLAWVGLFDQLFGGKAWSQVTLVFLQLL